VIANSLLNGVRHPRDFQIELNGRSFSARQFAADEETEMLEGQTDGAI